VIQRPENCAPIAPLVTPLQAAPSKQNGKYAHLKQLLSLNNDLKPITEQQNYT